MSIVEKHYSIMALVRMIKSKELWLPCGKDRQSILLFLTKHPDVFEYPSVVIGEGVNKRYYIAESRIKELQENLKLPR